MSKRLGLRPQNSETDIYQWDCKNNHATGVWWLQAGTCAFRLKLEQMQRLNLIALTRRYRVAPAPALKVLAGIPSIELKIDQKKD